MSEEANALWFRFGTELKRLRRVRGLSQHQVARGIHLSNAMVSAIERGTRAPKREHAERLDGVLQCSGTLVRLWVSLVNQDSYPVWFQEVVEWESKAVEIKEYHDSLIPGLLQTEDYARAILRNGRPWDTEEAVEELVVARMKRRQLLDHPMRPLLWFVVNEATLRDIVHNEATADAQLGRIAALIEKRVIRFQIVRSTVRAHPSRSGEFRIMGFKDRPMLVCVGHKFGELVIDSPEEVHQANTLYSALQGEALSPDDSLQLIREINGEPDD